MKRPLVTSAIVVLSGLPGCREQLIHNLSEQQANRLITRLHDTDIESRKTQQPDNRWTVEVGREDLSAAMREMQKLRLIRDGTPTLSEGSSVIASREQQRFAFERALCGEIEQTLSAIDGVLEARTHLNLPAVDPLFGKIMPGATASGSVLLVVEDSFSVEQAHIASLVAGASGIPSEKIAVLIERQKGSNAPEPDPAPLSTAQEVADPSLVTIFQRAKMKGYFTLMAGLLFSGGGAWLLARALTNRTVRE